MNVCVKFFAQLLLCGLSFCCAAFVCALIIFGITPNPDWRVMLFTSSFSATAIALIGWALFTSLGTQVKVWKGISVGVLSGSISHFFAWYLSMLYFYFQNTQSSSGEPTINPVDGIWASLVMTLFSLGIFGWITIPVGAVLGGTLAAFSRRFLSKPLS